MNNTNDEQNKGRLASAKGFANENRLLAALLERGYNASRVDLPLSTYDIVVEKSRHDIIRVQVKTVSKGKSISFRGGVRAGRDRTSSTGETSYTHSTETGVESQTTNGDTEINFYLIPTLHIEKIGQKSLSINKIPQAKKQLGDPRAM